MWLRPSKTGLKLLWNCSEITLDGIFFKKKKVLHWGSLSVLGLFSIPQNYPGTTRKMLWNCSGWVFERFSLRVPQDSLLGLFSIPWNCPEAALKLPWNCSETALGGFERFFIGIPQDSLLRLNSILWKCPETAPKLLRNCFGRVWKILH